MRTHLPLKKPRLGLLEFFMQLISGKQQGTRGRSLGGHRKATVPVCKPCPIQYLPYLLHPLLGEVLLLVGKEVIG